MTKHYCVKCSKPIDNPDEKVNGLYIHFKCRKTGKRKIVNLTPSKYNMKKEKNKRISRL
jgi:hypothetical protein